MRTVLLAVALSFLAGCSGSSRFPTLSLASPETSVQPKPPSLESLAGDYTLTIEVGEACISLPPSARIRTYAVSLRVTPYQYLHVATADPALGGDLWNDLFFRWNDDENGTDCGTSEKVAATSFCLWGNGRAVAEPDGTLSGVITGGVQFGQDRCYRSHQFVLRRRN